MGPPRPGFASALGPPGQPLEAQPLLHPETPPIVAPLLDLIAHAGGLKAMLKVGRAKQDVPPRQQHAKVVTAQGVLALRLVSEAHRVVQTMKAWTDPQALAQGSKPDAQIGMLKTLAQLRQRDNRHKLPRRNADGLGQQRINQRLKQVIEQVVSVVAPQGELAL